MVSLVVEIQFLIFQSKDQYVPILFMLKHPRTIQELCEFLHRSSHFVFLNRLYDIGVPAIVLSIRSVTFFRRFARYSIQVELELRLRLGIFILFRQ